MTHPRLSVSEMCTYPWGFGDELRVWDDLGVHHVGVITAKLEAYGTDEAVSALGERSVKAATVITRSFDLSAPETWDTTRAQIDAATDLARQIGGCVYFTPGRRDGRSFDELTASLADAVQPCAAYAAAAGIRLAIEPSLRTDVSFVHTLRDGLDVAEAAGIDVIADLGNCWIERDYEKTVRRAGPRLACVQFADAIFGTSTEPPPGGRAVPGDGDLPIDRFLVAALEAGYDGVFELEQVGPRIEAEGHEPALRRAVERANSLLEEVLG
ncbi:MAG TPA: sugar phosphate isomerase/epimerase [Acidimicrobiales bacterium]|nr:sugar phosphate isomerase/epimerase [Acidimicrobiales bacterium]